MATEKQLAKVRKYLDALEEKKLVAKRVAGMQMVREHLDKLYAFQEIEDREMAENFKRRIDRKMIWRTCLRCDKEFISEKINNCHICTECKNIDKHRAYSEQLTAKKETLENTANKKGLSGSVNCAVTNAKNNKRKRGVPFKFKNSKTTKKAATKKAAKKCR